MAYVEQAAEFADSFARSMTGYDTVTLLREARWHGFVGGRIESGNRDRVVFLMSELRNGLRFEVLHANVARCCGVLALILYPPYGGNAQRVRLCASCGVL